MCKKKGTAYETYLSKRTSTGGKIWRVMGIHFTHGTLEKHKKKSAVIGLTSSMGGGGVIETSFVQHE